MLHLRSDNLQLKKSLRMLKRFSEINNTSYSMMIGFKFVSTATSILSTYLFKVLIDHVIINRNLVALLYVCIGQMFVFALTTVTGYIYKLKETNYKNAFSYNIRAQLWSKMTTIPNKSLRSYGEGELKNRIDNDVNTLTDFHLSQAIDSVYYVINFVSVFLILFTTNSTLTFICLLTIPITFVITFVLGKKIKASSESRRSCFSTYEGWMHFIMKNHLTIKTQTMEHAVIDRFRDQWLQLSIAQKKNDLIFFLSYVLQAFKDFLLVRMCLLFIGCHFLVSQSITVGVLITFVMYFEIMFGAVHELSTLKMNAKSIKPIADRVDELLDFRPSENKKISEEDACNDVFIEMKNVQLFQTNDSSSFSLRLPALKFVKGDFVVIVGKSGSGKSTLLKLITNLLSPTAGSICISGTPLTDLDDHFVYDDMCILMQENYVFNLTIKENLLWGNTSASDEEIIDACRKVNLHEDILRMKDEYETIIGENGTKLSGGQRQRLVMARLLLRNKTIMILDEATSSLDSISESAIESALSNISKDKIILYATHKLSSVNISNRVIMLQDGLVVMDGKPEEVKKTQMFTDLFGTKT